jgi:hypothetical protein
VSDERRPAGGIRHGGAGDDDSAAPVRWPISSPPIENDNTRMAYYPAVCSFFAWLEGYETRELADIEPFQVAA